MTTIKAPSGRLVLITDGTFVINATGLRCSAWWAQEYAPLFRWGDRKGENIDLPTVIPERAERRRRTGSDVELQMMFGGQFKPNGDAYSTTTGRTAYEQLFINVKAFTDAVVADPGGNSAVTSTYTDPSGNGHTTAVQVLDLIPGSYGAARRTGILLASLRLRCPAGGWL